MCSEEPACNGNRRSGLVAAAIQQGRDRIETSAIYCFTIVALYCNILKMRYVFKI